MKPPRSLRTALTVVFIVGLAGGGWYAFERISMPANTASTGTSVTPTPVTQHSTAANTAHNTVNETHNPNLPSQAAPAHRHAVDGKKLAELIEKHISPSMRQQINEMLQPGGNPPAVFKNEHLTILNTSDRAASVVYGFEDEEAGLVVTDFTQPLRPPLNRAAN